MNIKRVAPTLEPDTSRLHVSGRGELSDAEAVSRAAMDPSTHTAAHSIKQNSDRKKVQPAKERLRALQGDIANAEGPEEAIEIFASRSLDEELDVFAQERSNRLWQILCGVAGGVGLTILTGRLSPDLRLIPLITGFLFAAYAGFRLYQLRCAKGDLKHALMSKVVLGRNGLQWPPRSEMTYEWAADHFPDFVCGDESQHVELLAEGQWTFEHATTPVRPYHFSYVVVTREQVYDHNTKTYHTEERRTTHHRYGIVFRCPSEGTVNINRDWFGSGIRWKTAFPAFESRFKVRTSSELAASRLLTPVVQTALVALTDNMSGISLTLCASGDACLSFDDANWLRFDAKPGIDEADQLIALLQRPAPLPKLDAVRECIGAMVRSGTNRFETQGGN